MHTKDAIKSLYRYLDTRIDIPVQVAGTESRPVPSLTIDDWSVSQRQPHNSRYAGSDYTNTGYENARYYHFYYTLRLDLLVRSDTSADAHQKLENVQRALAPVVETPSRLNEDVSRFYFGNSSGVTHQFNVPSEEEVMLAVYIESYFQTAEDQFDILQDISIDIIHDQL